MLTEGMTEGKYKVEFMYKPESEASWLRLSQNYAGNGVVNGGGFQNHLYMHFKNDGQIQFGIESLTENYNVGMWEPNEWYHVEIELNPVEDWRFKLKINDRLVAEGHHPSFLKPMTRLQVQMIAQAGEETSMWLDDIKFTRIYG